MADKLRSLISRYRELLVYLIFGGLTTVVSFAVYWPLCNLLLLPAWLSNGISWVISVAFAFVTNKPFVFGSHDWSWRVVWPELYAFGGCRIASGLGQTGLLYLMVDLLRGSKTLWWLIITVLVVVANYVGSKLFAFKK